MNLEPSLDRSLQREILVGLRKLMPYGTDNIEQDINPSDCPRGTLLANLIYLQEHGLIRHGFQRQDYMAGNSQYIQTFPAEITAKGLDFLANDGGLSAILGVMTIKIHDDTLKSLIEAKILQSDLAQPDKKRWLDQLRLLPVVTKKHLVLKLVDLGLANAPTALGAIGTALGLGAGG